MKKSENPEKMQGIGIAEMRSWDMVLLERYRPRHHALTRVCTLCGLSPCDLDRGRRGACGQDLETFVAREALILAVTGAAAHAAHARDVVERLRADRGDFLLDLGDRVEIQMPIARITAGTRPERLADLDALLEYVDAQIVRLLAAAHFGGESGADDLESKTLHAGTMDLLSMEIAEAAQISGYRFPSGRSGASPQIPLGPGDPENRKPLILCIGHHAAVGYRIVDRLDSSGRGEHIDVAGLCCTAHEMARYSLRGDGTRRDPDSPDSVLRPGPMVIGNLRDQLSFIRSGRADVVVVDQQCIRPDLISEAMRTGAFFITTSDLNCGGLPGDAGMEIGALASELMHRSPRAVFVPDAERAAALSVALAERHGRVASPAKSERPATAHTARCIGCGVCTEHCPFSLPVAEMISSLVKNDQEKGDVPDPAELAQRCLACGRCSAACPEGVPVMEIVKAAARSCRGGAVMRVGRGPIDDYEIKSTGPSIVLGDTPGVVAFLTCPAYQDGRDSVSWIARRLAERGYIVLAAGCAAIDIGLGDPAIFTDFPGAFETGGVINLGSCVSSSHAVGALIKVASIFLHRRLDRNFAEIADYILNRIGAVAMMWGGMTPKSFSASAGANRLGIPVIFGPRGYRFRRTLEGKEGKHPVFDARSGRHVMAPLAPAQLCTVAKTREEALIEAVRLCLRPNDTTWGRQTKLHHYIELSETFRGGMPRDVADWVRVEDDLPEERRKELLRMIEKSGWQPSFIPDPTILEHLVRHGKDAG